MRKYLILIGFFLGGIVWSGINPHDYITWFLEVLPAILGLAVLLLTYRKFRFTDLTYLFILLHCYVLFIGGHYMYAHVPLFDWLKELFGMSRNNYDKLGHFAQGFVPAMIARELFIRREVVRRGAWLPFLTVCVCLSISLAYELIEWLVAVLAGGSAEALIATQGYIWDAQSDMLWALIGSVCMVLFMSKIQNRHIEAQRIGVLHRL